MGLLADLGVAPVDLPSIEDIDKKMASGDLPPEGIHHAVLDSVGPIPNCDGRGWKMVFKILAGPGKGATVEEALWKPKGENEKNDATTRNRILLFGHRLGLLKKGKGPDGKDAGTVEVEGKHDFCDCLGATTFIELTHEVETYEKGGKEKKITRAKLTFNGLLSADDKKVLAAKVPTGKADAVTPKKADNFDNF